jgi:hypothetical protein
MSPYQFLSNKQVFLVMIVRDAVQGKAYDLKDLDDVDKVRICYTGPYGTRSMLECYVAEVTTWRSKLEDRGCAIDAIQLVH